MQLTIQKMQITAAVLDSDNAPTSIPKIQTGLAYYDWKESMNNYLDQQRGVGGAPLRYVICEDKLPGWDPATDATNEMERLMYQVQLTGPKFEQDNCHLLQILKESCIGDKAYEWIRSYDAMMDGREAMIALCTHYEGTDQKDKRSIVAEANINTGPGGLYYRNETAFSFDLYASELQKSYTV